MWGCEGNLAEETLAQQSEAKRLRIKAQHHTDTTDRPALITLENFMFFKKMSQLNEATFTEGQNCQADRFVRLRACKAEIWNVIHR